MNIKTVPLSELSLDPKNARKHSQRNLDAIAASLSKFGQRKPIVVQSGLILAGNGTYEAAKSLGWKEISIAEVPADWDNDTAKAYALADNRSAELAEWDENELAKQLLELQDNDWDISQLGFDVPDIAETRETEEDEIPEPPVEPVTQVGDIYQLGRHRLMCGDSTDLSTVERLMDGAKADMVLTDPPYNINYSGLTNKFDKIKNDKMSDESFTQFLINALKTEAETYYVFCSWQYSHLFRTALEAINKPVKAFIVWNKVNPAQNLDKYYKAHEIILYSGKFGGQKTLRSDVWEHKRERNTDHPTMKPIALLTMALEDTPDAKIIYDAFGGSGSTLIACEQANRTNYTIELDPKYCDVIVKRWENLTGLKAELISK